MKITTFLIATFILSCFGLDSMENSKNYSKQDLLSISKDNYTVTLDKNSGSFYVLQTTRELDFPTNASFVNYDKQSISVKDNKSNRNITYALGSQIFGIAQLQGEGYMQALITNESGVISFVQNVDDIIQALSCTCVQNDTQSDCQSGGEGANECNVVDGGTVATVTWDNQCSVSCNQGYYACCNE